MKSAVKHIDICWSVWFGSLISQFSSTLWELVKVLSNVDNSCDNQWLIKSFKRGRRRGRFAEWSQQSPLLPLIGGWEVIWEGSGDSCLNVHWPVMLPAYWNGKISRTLLPRDHEILIIMWNESRKPGVFEETASVVKPDSIGCCCPRQQVVDGTNESVEPPSGEVAWFNGSCGGCPGNRFPLAL